MSLLNFLKELLTLNCGVTEKVGEMEILLLLAHLIWVFSFLVSPTVMFPTEHLNS